MDENSLFIGNKLYVVYNVFEEKNNALFVTITHSMKAALYNR